MCFGDGMFCVLTMAFAVNPQDELDRKEGRLAVMADHLGFSWTGKKSSNNIWRYHRNIKKKVHGSKMHSPPILLVPLAIF